MLTGIDVSHHQKAAKIDWAKLREQASFCIVRLTYGVRIDAEALLHIRGARSVGMAVGGYHFYMQSEPALAQFEAFHEQMGVCEIGAGDIIPTVDVEDNTTHDGAPDPNRVDRAKVIVDWLDDTYGACMIYGSRRDWTLYGSPAWWLTHPLWVAHYTKAAAPATPGDKPWTIWQRAGNARLRGFAGELDVNICQSLPRI